MKLYSLEQLELEDSELSFDKNNIKKINYEIKSIYIWGLSAYFSNYIMSNCNVENLMYVDSDIYFYNNIKYVLDEINNKSIGIIRHRISPHFQKIYGDVGEYNVGIVFFKNSDSGKECLKKWRSWVYNQNNEYYKEYGTIGDQKYLELFPILFPEQTHIIDNIGHGAPWNLFYYDFENENFIIWEGKRQIFVFNHYSRFLPDFDKNSYILSELRYDKKYSSSVYKMYDDYFDKIKKISKWFLSF